MIVANGEVFVFSSSSKCLCVTLYMIGIVNFPTGSGPNKVTSRHGVVEPAHCVTFAFVLSTLADIRVLRPSMQLTA